MGGQREGAAPLEYGFVSARWGNLDSPLLAELLGWYRIQHPPSDQPGATACILVPEPAAASTELCMFFFAGLKLKPHFLSQHETVHLDFCWPTVTLYKVLQHTTQLFTGNLKL